MRVLQHREEQKRELLQELWANANASARSQSLRKWASKRAGTAEYPWYIEHAGDGDGHPTEGESSGIPASPSSARRRRRTAETSTDNDELWRTKT